MAKLKAGGGREFYDAATVEIRVTASAVDQHLGPDGKPVAPPPDPLGDWLAKLDGNTELQEALSVYATAADWFDLYKAYEAIKKALGGQKLVESVIGASMRSRLTQTANHHRHPDVSLPAKPVTYQEALQLVGRLFEAWLAKS
ncbi:MAG: hypothetical protein M3540_02185 [Actinomycetota bacterium]|nr:hypothetical protein [Actinomycetota bacterium]